MLPRAFGHNSLLGQLNERLHLQPRLLQILNGDGSGLVNGLLGAGQVMFSALSSTLIVIVLTVYFLVDMPRIRANLYRLVPHSRRPRAILLGDEIFAKVGGYVLGNLLISLIAGVLTFIAVLLAGLPYPLLLSIFVALLDLVRVVKVPALVTVVAVLVGGALLGIVGALVAIPVAASVLLLAREVLFPRLDQT
jgi:predicted PurR-regulated permease PerM